MKRKQNVERGQGEKREAWKGTRKEEEMMNIRIRRPPLARNAVSEPNDF
jgi:hypothetical protein